MTIRWWGWLPFAQKKPRNYLASKKYWKYYGGNVFFREGSMSMPKVFDIELTDSNSEIVASIESHSRNNIEYTLDGVFDFMAQRKDYNPTYKVFKEYFVMCWSGQKKNINTQTFYSRVDIALLMSKCGCFIPLWMLLKFLMTTILLKLLSMSIWVERSKHLLSIRRNSHSLLEIMPFIVLIPTVV